MPLIICRFFKLITTSTTCILLTRLGVCCDSSLHISLWSTWTHFNIHSYVIQASLWPRSSELRQETLSGNRDIINNYCGNSSCLTSVHDSHFQRSCTGNTSYTLIHHYCLNCWSSPRKSSLFNSNMISTLAQIHPLLSLFCYYYFCLVLCVHACVCVFVLHMCICVCE